MKLKIVLSGVGGQGLISTGEIIGEAASIYENAYATLTSSYGSETRGTFTKSDVIVSDAPINYPNIETPDVILCLAQVAYDRYVNRLGEHTLVFYDTEQVTPSEGAKGTHIGYNFREMSIELGNPAVANTIALGLIAKKTSMLRRNSLVSAIQEYFSAKPKVIGVNIQALDAGMALG
ncbi:2-oxoglutarate synthase [Colidextribacter sp. OB.20]|uniref:2-oxoacid:acceptor oxidoreductase family protein n=1 Tax=Colidextribacter sp. OB.20 TaxID=2304568 RepID=UPI00136DB110|nr:2-oxoacid:acceptor oxidoreductase family protein [Colidextribacter sp. OB.20]NBI11067.1 2-oxoglutarate synthase [Colidextribacter sp. OB.20]